MPIGKAAGSRTGGWSPEEKYEVLVGILKATGSFNKIPWGNFQPPEGRTLKACKHVIDGIKRELGLVNLHGQSKEGGIDESPGKGKKRKALSEAADDDDAGAEIADGGHKKRKTGSGKKGKGAKGINHRGVLQMQMVC